MKLKICGIRSKNMVDFCNKNKIEFTGFNFVSTSKRHILPQNAQTLSQTLKSKTVAVFQNQSLEEIEKILQIFTPDILQFHGTETVDYLQKIKKSFPTKEIWKSITIEEKTDFSKMQEYYNNVNALLFDAKNPGTGNPIKNLKNLQKAISFCQENHIKFGIAGGINSENIAKFCHNFPLAYFLDTASGVEKNGEFDEITAQILINGLTQN